MSLQKTPSSERTQIAFFGLRNAGKSSLINAITGQKVSIVSDHLGTTTDPVSKAMEILPLGPVLLIDTPGIDDIGDLGQMRVERSKEILKRIDIAILVVDATRGLENEDLTLIEEFKKRKLNFIIVYNKIDQVSDDIIKKYLNEDNSFLASTITGKGIEEIKIALGQLADKNKKENVIVSDLCCKEDLVVLVIPIDESAPKARLILPQQMVIRDLLDHEIIPVLTQVSTLDSTIKSLSKKPALVITDSQAFFEVESILEKDIKLTSFSILMARYKGSLKVSVQGARKLDHLKAGDKVLIAEGCTHHRQCEDIGTVKIPRLLNKHTGLLLDYEFSSGHAYPDNMKDYALVIHCGGCMLSDKEVASRYEEAINAGLDITNYGIAIAHMNGILERSIEMLNI